VYSSSLYNDVNLNSIIDSAKTRGRTTGNNTGILQQLFQSVNSQSASPRKQQTLEILRFNPGVSFDKDMQRKNTIANIIIPHYRTLYPTSNYSFTNYNCLNFFTGSSVPTGSVLLYPHSVSVGSGSTSLTGSYILPAGFSFDFWIKPSYTNDSSTAAFKAGTLFHLSSSYAVSLISGSHRDVNGKVDRFRLLLQLSSSATITPSNINTSSLPSLVFLSDDNVLQKDYWHHVTIRWGTSTRNNGTGSFIIDGETAGTFVIPSASVAAAQFGGSFGQPDVLCVGNFFEGTNQSVNNLLALFFNAPVAEAEGVMELMDTNLSTYLDRPVSYGFNHPLNAEAHELKIFDRYLSDTEIESFVSSGPGPTTTGLKFYVPPFFTRESPTRTYNSSLARGGILVTPFFEEDGTTTHPFNVDMSFDVGGQYMNLENYLRDFATGKYPRMLELTASAITVPNNLPESANVILYNTGSVRKRQLTILPCDNGRFLPNYSFLNTLSTSSFVTDLGAVELGTITLRNMYPTSSILTGQYIEGTGSMLRTLTGPDPEDSSSLGRAPGVVPTILQRTRENSSNQVALFDISQLFYGNNINPGSLTLSDYSLSGSSGKVAITLKDDGRGNVYRCNTSSSVATWNNVGNIFYNEGIILLKNPALYFFGADNFTLDFKGQQNIHIMSIACTAAPLMETSSSNPTYIPVSASTLASDQDKKYVYITDVYIHDDNLNVIAKTQLAQPVVKRTGEKLVFKFKMNF
jgi:hypothetical protein